MEIETLFKRVHWQNKEAMQRKENEEEECPVSVWLQALDRSPTFMYRNAYTYM